MNGTFSRFTTDGSDGETNSPRVSGMTGEAGGETTENNH